MNALWPTNVRIKTTASHASLQNWFYATKSRLQLCQYGENEVKRYSSAWFMHYNLQETCFFSNIDVMGCKKLTLLTRSKIKLGNRPEGFQLRPKRCQSLQRSNFFFCSLLWRIFNGFQCDLVYDVAYNFLNIRLANMANAISSSFIRDTQLWCWYRGRKYRQSMILRFESYFVG